MHYWNDGADGFIWEPLYRKKIGLTPCEQQLLMHPRLRRLQGIAHYGASARVLPMTHTRFTHTLGVFTLAVHFRPEDWTLRLAALLHDVGHIPFSHSAERALGLNHHLLTEQALEEGGLNAILRGHGFDPTAVAHAMESGPLKGAAAGHGNFAAPAPGAAVPGLGLDHLDSFLRDTETCGMGETPAHLLLADLHLDGDCLEAGSHRTAREIVRRVAADHRLFLKPRCLGLDALAGEIFRQAGLTVDELLQLTDEPALDRAATRVPDLVDRLRNRPWSVAVSPDPAAPGWPVAVTKLYAGQVRVEGRPVTEVLPEARAVYESLAQWKQAYRVTLL